VIQSILFFALGFLSAGFLALMIAPAVWRRAVALTRKRIEATVPMTLNEIQAEKDRMRAEFAMAARRLEMKLQSQQEKVMGQTVEINRNREELKLLTDECSTKSQTIGELEAQASNLRAELRKREEELQKLSGRLADAESRLEERAAEVDSLSRQLDEANFVSSNRQIELVARETETDKLLGDINILRSQQRETEKRAREIAAENKASQEALRAERKRAAEAEKKLERLLSAASDGEEKLGRREKELARLREEARRSSESANELRTRLIETEKARDRLQAQLAKISERPSSAASGGKPEDSQALAQKDAAEKTRLEERLTALVRENKRLRTDLTAAEQAKPPAGTTTEDGALRAQIQGLAAEVVSLAAALEGPGSPIREALAGGSENGTGAGPSLADRIRALQKSGAGGLPSQTN
jgi:chromosome segregation ATPase